MRMIKEQFISWFKKGFDGMRAGLTEGAVTDITKIFSKGTSDQRGYQLKRLSFRPRIHLYATLLVFMGIVSVPQPAQASSPAGIYEPVGQVVWSGSFVGGQFSMNNLDCQNVNGGLSIGGRITGGETTWGTVDGYTGLVLGPGVVLFFTGESSMNSKLIENALGNMGINSDLFAIYFNSTGGYIANAPDERRLNWADIILYFYPQGITEQGVFYGIEVRTSGFMKAHLYVSERAEPGTYSITSPITLREPCNRSSYSRGSLADVGDIVIALPPRLCNIAISPESIESTPQVQSMMASIQKTGTIGIKGSCTLGDTSTSGNVQFSIIADNPVSSNIGGVDSALALINANNKKVGSVYFQNQAWSSNYLSVIGNKYSVPVQWSDINFDVNYTIVDLAPSDTQAFGVGRGRAKFIVEWP